MAYVIGVAAQAQMGKDTLSDYLQEKLNVSLGEEIWIRDAFAANVKRVYEDTFDVARSFTEEWKVQPDKNPPGFDMPTRKALQFIGDGFRQIKRTIWIDLCFRDNMPKIISDVRYVNEFSRVKQEGGLNVLVGRTKKINDDPNGSESQIRPYCDWALKNFRTSDGAPRNFVEIAKESLDGATEGMNLFDVFIRNDSTKEEFYKTIETKLVPFVNSFVFDFPQLEEKQEIECLISS